MVNNKFSDILETFLYDDQQRQGVIDLISDEVQEFYRPEVLFFGNVPEKKVQNEVLLGGYDNKLNLITDLFKDLDSGISIILNDCDEQGKKLLSYRDVELIATIYGIMSQFYAKRDKDLDRDEKMVSQYGLLTINATASAKDCYEDTLTIGRKAIANVVGKLRLDERNGYESWANEIEQLVEEDVPILFPAASICIVDDESKKFYNPFVNFDLGLGGRLGWYRLERLVKPYIGKELPQREGCKQVLLQKLEDIEDFLLCCGSFIDSKEAEEVVEKRIRQMRGMIW